MTRILVTGAAGVNGYHFLQRLCRRGAGEGPMGSEGRGGRRETGAGAAPIDGAG